MNSTIDKSGKINKEIGFVLCKNRHTGKFSAGHICEGDTCNVSMMRSIDLCYKKGADIGGNFHTHPYVKKHYTFADPNMYIHDIKKMHEDEDKHIYQEIGIDMKPLLVLPSFPDVLETIDINCGIKKYRTVCVGSDINPGNIECWTVKSNVLDEEIWSKRRNEI